jgi:uncharacterized membrane protein
MMEARGVSAGNGWSWIVGGFALFRQSPVIWIVLFFVYLLIGMALSMIPLIGSIAFNLVAPVFMAGFMLGCRAIEMGEELEINHLFAGFRQNTAQLITVGGIYLVGIIVVAGVVMLAGGGDVMLAMSRHSVMGAGQATAQAPNTGFLLALLLGLAALLPLIMAYWFAPTLVVFHDMPALQAMRLSLRACLSNILPFLVYTVISAVLLLLAMIPLGLGLLVMIPTITASLYVSYRDVFNIQLVTEEAEADAAKF